MAKNFKTVRITPTCFNGTTNAQSEVLFNPTEIKNAVAHNGGAALLKSVSIVDFDDNADDDYELYFSQLGTNDLGTLGAVIDITDAELVTNKSLGWVAVPGVTNNEIGDMVLSRISTVTGIDLVVQAEGGSSSIFVGCVCGTAATVSTTSGLELILGFEQL
tara:strand:+ start:1096 stop:1578 length:483 start_codon:yes stop_codon:yes gene_type:complete